MSEETISRWNINFNGLKFDELLQECLDALKELDIGELAPEDLAEYARLLKVINVLRVRLSAFDPELASETLITNLATYLNKILSHINSLIETKNLGHLKTANQVIDSVLDLLPHSDLGRNVKISRAIASANAAFQKKIVEELESIRRRRTEIENEFESFQRAVAQNRESIDETDQTIQQQKSRLDQSIAEFQKQFSEAQEKRATEFGAALKTQADENSEHKNAIEAESDEAVSKMKKSFEQVIANAIVEEEAHTEYLEGRRLEVDKIFGAIGTTAFAGNFKSTADNEAKAANLFRWIALSLMTAMITVAAYSFYHSIVHDTDWRVFLFRFGTILVFGVPAFYAASESTKHRDRERLNRKIHLELASVDAYLVLLPEEQRNSIKAGLAEKFFGLPLFEEKKDGVSHKDLMEIIKTAVTSATKS